MRAVASAIIWKPDPLDKYPGPIMIIVYLEIII
jgi:hypothetical protein